MHINAFKYIGRLEYHLLFSHIFFKQADILELAMSKEPEKIIQTLLTLKKRHRLAELSHKVTNAGNNLLHLVLLNYEAVGLEHFKTMIDLLGEDILVDLLHTSNNDLYAPMEIANSISDESTRALILRLLLPFAIRSSNKYMHHQEGSRTPPPSESNSKLESNLKRAVDAVDYSHSIIHRSSTHPSINSLDADESKNLMEEVYLSRKKRFESGPQLLSSHLSTVERDRVGNCEEYSLLAAKFLTSTMPSYISVTINLFPHIFQLYGLNEEHDLYNPSTWGPHAALSYNGAFIDKVNPDFSWQIFNDKELFYSFYGQKLQPNESIDTWGEDVTLIQMETPPYSVERVHFSNGDHVITVLDRDKNSDINQPSTYGPCAVIVDGWAKQSYPALEANKKLKDSYEILIDGRRYVFIKSYNPTYHRLSLGGLYVVRDPIMTWGDPDELSQDSRKPILFGSAIETDVNARACDKKEDSSEKSKRDKYKEKSSKPKYVVPAGNHLITASTSLEDLLMLVIELSKTNPSKQEEVSPSLEIAVVNPSTQINKNRFGFWSHSSPTLQPKDMIVGILGVAMAICLLWILEHLETRGQDSRFSLK